jgi:hypothetical protein
MEENVTLDPDLVNAIGKLRIFNTPIEPTGADPKQNCLNQEAVDSLQGSFARFTHAPHPGPILTWPIYAKRESVYGLRALQPFKLLVFAYWAVLLHESGANYWWAEGCGAALVAELSSELEDRNEKWKSALRWPQEKVVI